MPFKVRIHRSFLQLFVVLALFAALQGNGGQGLARFGAIFGLLFVTVILHELSHALVARALGVRVLDIVVHPLGGMTRLAWTAKDPRREALISCAGPATNLLIALVIWAFAWPVPDEPGRWMTWLVIPFFTTNLALGALNLVPAFPMDGGRILRALLSTRLGHLRATRLAARIGRWIAAATLLAPLLAPQFGWSFLQALVIPLAGLFVFFLGELELKQAEAAELLQRMQNAARGAAGERTPPPGVIDVSATSRVVED
jgi:Zn-dependent protease